MTIQRDPPRLLDPDSPIDPALRELLRAGTTGTPSAAQLEALAHKVGASSAAQVGTSAALHGRWFAGMTVAPKVGLALVVAGTVAWLAWSPRQATQINRRDMWKQADRSARTVTGETRALPPSAAERSATPKPEAGHSAALPTRAHTFDAPRGAERIVRSRSELAQPERAAAARARQPRGAAAEPASHATEREVVASEPTRREVDQAEARPTARPAASTRASASELSLLRQVQGLLAQDPEAALDVSEEHALQYPNGQFAEEREALAIDALRRLGRRQELQARAEAFLRRYPASPHRARIAAWLR